MASFEPHSFIDRTGQEFVIRTARAEDAADLLAHVIVVAQQSDQLLTEPDEFNVTEHEERRWIQDHLDGPGNICLLAEASGVIIGSLGCENGHRRRIAHRGTFGMAVLREWRGRGVGSALLQCFLEWAESNELIEKVSLGVTATNEAAIGLYRKFGFVEEGRQPKEVKLGPGQYDDAILMYRLV